MSSSRSGSSSHKKVLLMGKSGSGKSSMRAIVFNSRLASETTSFQATVDTEQTKIKFLGGLNLDLWDCGGQDTYMDQHLTSQSSTVFRACHSLIYIFDVESEQLLTADVHYFTKCLAALKAQNPEPASHDASGASTGGPTVYVLLHKMDLISDAEQKARFSEFEANVRRKTFELGWKGGLAFYGTSIWNETLYKAWSVVISNLMPSLASLRSHLSHFLNVTSASEVVLFEKTTFLVILSVTHPDAATASWDERRFERISNIVKAFRLASTKVRQPFASFTISTATYTAVLDRLTDETFILVLTKPSIQPAAIELNIKLARPHFSKLESIGVSR